MENISKNQEIEEKKENLPLEQQNQVFNPQKLPLYIGIFAEDTEHPRVREYILKGLEQLTDSYKNDKNISEVYEELQKAYSSFKLIKDLHITTLYIGGNKALRNSEYFKDFRLGYEQDIEIVAFVVVPGKIMTGICYPDQSVIKVQNEFPHVTLTIGSWPPQLSNDLLKALCGKDGPLEKEYNKKEFLTSKAFTSKESLKVGKETVTAYVVKTPAHLVLKGKTKAM